jgi:hypothetical protein
MKAIETITSLLKLDSNTNSPKFMPEWKESYRKVIDEVELVVKERTDLRNRHGALEYSVSAFIGGKFIRSERVPQSTWLGHCSGQLLLPLIAERALANLTHT